MMLHVGCTLGYEVLSPTANFTFNILVNFGQYQSLVTEDVGLVPPEVPIGEREATTKGNRVFRVEAPTGPLRVNYRATVEVTRPAMPERVEADNPGRLPLSILTYMLPSRYCESDRFAPMAWELFGKIGDRAEQVREICRWINATLAYTPGSTDSRTSAWDVWELKKGVCRDYTHLAIALCRALSIPTRYVGGYAAGLQPMDFHACFEVYLGGRWYIMDPTDGIAPDHIAIIARGRDAANAPLATIFGRVEGKEVKVTCEEEETATSAPGANGAAGDSTGAAADAG